jgi:LPS-assembly protein
MSIAEMRASLPMIKKSTFSQETLTPKISLRANPGNNMKNYSGSNKLLDSNNIFEINRLGLNDTFETGKSLTFGVDYKFDLIENDTVNNKVSEDEIVLKDKFLEFKLATVFRDSAEIKIPSSSTIDKKNSGLFGSLNNQLFKNLELGYDFITNNNYDSLESHALSSKFSVNNFVTEFGYVERTSNLGADHVLSNKTSYEVNESNFLSFSTRRNKEINLTEYYDLSYEYKNDCLTAGIKYNKTFYQDNDLKPSENLFFTITLIPLTTYERIIYEN